LQLGSGFDQRRRFFWRPVSISCFSISPSTFSVIRSKLHGAEICMKERLPAGLGAVQEGPAASLLLPVSLIVNFTAPI